jgi:hypothetical protein
MEPTIDKGVVNLMKALKQHESGGDYKSKGGSGEYGAYQFTAPTFKSYATQYAKMPNARIDSPEDQDKVTYYSIKGMKDKGYTPEQILSEWNSGDKDAYTRNHKGTNEYGVKYDTPAYVDAIKKIALEQAKKATPEATPTTEASVSQETPVPESGITGNETAGQAGMNALKNTIPSAVNFGKGVVGALNPLNTLGKLGEVGTSFAEGSKEMGAGNLIGETIKGLPKAAYETLVPKGIRQIFGGDIQGASKTMQEDPFGTVAPVVLAGVGGVKALAKGEVARNTASMKGYVENIGENVKNKVPIPEVKNTYQNINNAVDTGISKTAGIVTKPLGYVTDKITGGVGTLATSLASHITSLEPATIRQILSDPKEFSKLAQEQTTRGGLAGEVKSAIDTRLKDLTETGKGYDAIRNSNQTIQAPNFMADVLSKNGFKIKNGKILADTNSVTRNTADIGALQKFYDNWGNKTTFTPNEFLNMRGDIAELAKFDRVTGMGKTKASQMISKDIYSKANETMRDTQLQELKALDETYSPEVNFLKQVKKDYFNPDGTFKDNAVSKIANAGNKAELLKRLEAVMPGITKRIQILKAVEDIQSAMGSKVGTYTRGVLQGGAFITGNVAGIIAMIITHPTNAVKILRSAGYTASTVAPILEYLKIIGGDIKIPEKGLLLSNQPMPRQELQSKIPGLFQGNVRESVSQ